MIQLGVLNDTIMSKLNARQLKILEFIKEKGKAGNLEIKKYLQKEVGLLSRVTIVRDIDRLLLENLILKIGEGRGVKYKEKESNKILKHINIDEYFKKTSDQRRISFESFNFDIFKNLNNIFTESELEKLNGLNIDYRKRIKKLSPIILKKEFERLSIELAWKSSRIEGNTYSLIDTEILIKEQKKAEGHTDEEAIMILNHKYTLDYILNSKTKFKKLDLREVKHLHKILIEGLNISDLLRKKPIGIIGTKYKPLDNQYKIKEAMEDAVKTINSLSDPFSKALIAILLISYIQPFEDGNKRTSRLLGDALLMAYDVCPLSFRSVDEADYKKAIILFYEENNAKFFKELFIEQFEFAVKNYFLDS